jgi:hypothetical protein
MFNVLVQDNRSYHCIRNTAGEFTIFVLFASSIFDRPGTRFPICRCEVLCGTSSTFCPFDMISRETLIIPPAIDSDVARIREQRRTHREQTAAANVENEEHMLALIKLEPMCFGLGLDTVM